MSSWRELPECNALTNEQIRNHWSESLINNSKSGSRLNFSDFNSLYNILLFVKNQEKKEVAPDHQLHNNLGKFWSYIYG